MTSENSTATKRLAFFERYLTLWVFLCMVAGVVIGKLLPNLTMTLSKMQFGQGSQVNIPILYYQLLSSIKESAGQKERLLYESQLTEMPATSRRR